MQDIKKLKENNLNKELVLSVNNISFGYTKNNLIYQDFSLELFKGEVVSIVGKSGSGKSTLFELISGNLKPFSGDIKVGKISFIFQDPYSSFHPSFSIYNQILDVVNDIDKQSLDKLLSELSLDYDTIYSLPRTLSGGQLQRCSILRAILMKPDILLADEPTSALDNIIALDVMKLLLQYLDRFAIMLITHDKDLASWCSDKIVYKESNHQNNIGYLNDT